MSNRMLNFYIDALPINYIFSFQKTFLVCVYIRRRNNSPKTFHNLKKKSIKYNQVAP